MTTGNLATVTAALFALSTVTKAQRLFTLDDLLPGGDTYEQLKPETRHYQWSGKTLVESEEKDEKDSRLPQEAKNTDKSAKSGHTAYTIAGNLYVMTADGDALQLSADGSVDGSEDIVYGTSVHRNEFGIMKGTFWSPDGEKLAYYRMDQSMVPQFPLVDITTRIATTKTCHYPMAGEESHVVSVGIYDVRNGSTVWLNMRGEASDGETLPGEGKNDYHTNISWSPDGETIYVFHLNRAQNHMRVVAYDAATGQPCATVYEERHEKYVEPMTGLSFLPWDETKAVMQSQRDGYNHLYLIDLSGVGKGKRAPEPVQLTKGEWVVQQFVGFNVRRKTALFLANRSDPRTKTLYSVDMKGHIMPLGEEQGVHYDVQLSDDGTEAVDSYTTPDVPRRIARINTSTGDCEILFTAEDTWADYAAPQISSGSIKAADGRTELYYRMVKPADFDPTKRYPTVVYVYGGPHLHNVDASWHWALRGWEAYMAQLGYIIFVLDNRGAEWRGRDFEQVTWHQLGIIEREDQMEGVKYLTGLPYVDKERIGVHGWSYGGYMTINLMLTYPDVFKVGVAGGPVIDWKYYEVMYGERYMGTPQNNPDGYRRCDLKERADSLKGRLEIIIGGVDPVVVPQHALSFIRSCIDKGTQPDYFVYPGDEHNMFGKDRVHLHERITRYFEDYLK
mgnify:CR=1 FL=1